MARYAATAGIYFSSKEDSGWWRNLSAQSHCGGDISAAGDGSGCGPEGNLCLGNVEIINS